MGVLCDLAKLFQAVYGEFDVRKNGGSFDANGIQLRGSRSSALQDSGRYLGGADYGAHRLRPEGRIGQQIT